MIRVGWAKEDPVFRRVFTTQFIPDATEEQMRWFDDLQRMSTSPENAVASRIGRQEVDIADELPRITAPTLILQALGDRSTTFDNAVEVSARDPGRAARRARQPQPHPARRRAGLGDVRRRGRGLPRARSAALGGRGRRRPLDALSPRERDVLRLCADGPDERGDRGALTLSPRTVERHLSNVYLKLGLSRARRAGRAPSRGTSAGR